MRQIPSPLRSRSLPLVIAHRCPAQRYLLAMDASEKRRVTVATKRALSSADLDVTTMRDVLRGLQEKGVLSAGVEARRYAKAAVRKALRLGPPRHPVRLTLEVGRGGTVTARTQTRGW